MLNFAGTKFCNFRKILYLQKVSKPQNREIKHPQNLIPAKSEILFIPIFDQSMILIPLYRISLLIVAKLEFL